MSKNSIADHAFANDLRALAVSMNDTGKDELADMLFTAQLLIHEKITELDNWKRMAEDVGDIKDGNYWSWQGNGEDHLESMCSEMKVVISADDLRALSLYHVNRIDVAPHGSTYATKKVLNGHKFDRAMEGLK